MDRPKRLTIRHKDNVEFIVKRYIVDQWTIQKVGDIIPFNGANYRIDEILPNKVYLSLVEEETNEKI